MQSEKIALNDGNGKIRAVDHFGWFGQWAVTECTCHYRTVHFISGKKFRGVRYRVTHVPTGLSAGPCMTLSDTIKTCRTLSDISIMDDDLLERHRFAIYNAFPAKIRAIWVPFWIDRNLKIEPTGRLNDALNQVNRFTETPTISSGMG